MDIDQAHPPRIYRNLRVMPFHRASDRRVAYHAEVVAVVRVLRNPLPGKDQVFSERLLQSGVELVTKARTQRGQRRGRAEQKRVLDGIATPSARKDQIFVERRFQGARVGDAENGIRWFDVVRNPYARFSLSRDGDSIVEITPYPEVQR